MKLIFPSGLSYGVIRMDPLAMVKDLGLDDLDTLAAVEKLDPKKYLVYLEHPLDVPLPESRWCRYSMSPIATTLRAEDRKNGLLADMVVPIFPNMRCTSQKRRPVLPQGTFPSSNCFHWIENVTYIRVRRRHDGELFDDARAVSLNGEQHVAIQMAFLDDYNRMDELLSDDSRDSVVSACNVAPQILSGRSIPLDALHDPKVLQACSPIDLLRHSPSSSAPSGDTQASVMQQSYDLSSRSTTLGSNGGGSHFDTDLGDKTQQSIAREISGFNLFGWHPDPTFPLIPLVDLWLELEEHIGAHIPSPVDWYKEEEEIVSIIMEAFTRRIRSNSEVTSAADSTSQDEEPVALTSERDRSATAISTQAC